jgi:hypothetical protein
MRTLRFLVLGCPSLLLALAPVAACESSSTSSPGAFTAEAGTFEAGPLPEAAPPPPDAAPDAPPVPSGVLLTVLEGSLPKKDVRVLFHDATGAVTGESKTDATGVARVATAPAMVTVLTSRSILGGQLVPAQVTFLAVADGDKLTVTLPDLAPPPSVLVGHYQVSFADPAAGATSYDVSVSDGCTNSAQAVTEPVTVDLYPQCLAAKNAVLARGLDDTGAVVGYAFAKGVATPAANATSNVGALAFAAPFITTLHATNIPATATPEAQTLYSLVAEQPYYESTPTGTIASVAGLTRATAAGFADAYQSYVSMRSVASTFSSSGFVRREAPSASPPVFDFATALPFVTDATATGIGRPDVTVATTAPVTATDGGAVLLVWTDATTGRDDTWTFIVPASGTSFKVPALPADAAAFVPTAGAFVDDVTFVEATQLPGYKELKSVPVDPTANEPIQVITKPNVPLPAAGTVRFTHWNSGARG